MRYRVKSMDIRKELGVSGIQEKVRFTILRWYGHMQKIEESNDVRAVDNLKMPGKKLRGDQGEMDGIRRLRRHSGSPGKMHTT